MRVHVCVSVCVCMHISFVPLLTKSMTGEQETEQPHGLQSGCRVRMVKPTIQQCGQSKIETRRERHPDFMIQQLETITMILPHLLYYLR